MSARTIYCYDREFVISYNNSFEAIHDCFQQIGPLSVNDPCLPRWRQKIERSSASQSLEMREVIQQVYQFCMALKNNSWGEAQALECALEEKISRLPKDEKLRQLNNCISPIITINLNS